MEIYSVGSSSSGNSYIITTDDSTVILDVGLSARRIVDALYNIGRSPEDVEAILITHEHVDHIRSVRAIGKKCKNADFYVSRGTFENTEAFKDVDEDRISFVSAGESFALSEAVVETFALCHDAAEPLGFTIDSGDRRLAVVTDCGVVSDDIYSAVRDADILVLEANHDEDLLMYGDYPYHVKLRIKSDHGHLSNKAAGELLSEVLRYRSEERKTSERSTREGCNPLTVMLSHLSFHNNAPFRARSTIEEMLSDAGFERDTHYTLTIASKDEMTEM